MQQVAEWLEKLGLGQYAQRFAENDIDFALVAKLNDTELKELGVTSRGHRKRLLEAIAQRVAAAPSPTPAEERAWTLTATFRGAQRRPPISSGGP
jgi:SAM domain (Sterile alpha motif)